MFRIGVVGLGVIAAGRHLPAIAGNPDFELVAVADPVADFSKLAVPGFRSQAEMLAAHPEIEAVAICTPPFARTRMTLEALAAGRHVLIEKPPTPVVGEILVLRDAAERAGRVFFTAWHSQFNDAVDRARDLLAGTTVTGIELVWREDVNKYHPGQRWIWEPGGFGVLDAGINALSILTRILPERPSVRAAELVVPPDAATPIAARLQFSVGGRPVKGSADLDWRAATEQRTMAITTGDGAVLRLESSGERLVTATETVEGVRAEYPAIYRRFAELLRTNTSDVDMEPLVLACDALALGRR